MDTPVAISEALEQLHHRLAEVSADPALCRNQCGPLARAATAALRAQGFDAGMLFLVGYPPIPDGHPARVQLMVHGSAHYLSTVTVDGVELVVDVSYRQFDPGAPVPLVYPLGESELAEYGWDTVERRMSPADPLDRFEFGYLPERPAEARLANELRPLAGLAPITPWQI